MNFIETGDLTFVANGAAPNPIKLENSMPTIAVLLFLTAVITTDDGTGSVVTIEDGVKKLIRLVELRKGGLPVQKWGQNAAIGGAGQMLQVVNRTWMQNIEGDQSAAALLAVAGTAVADAAHTIKLRLYMPVSLPTNLYAREFINRTALRIGQNEWRVAVTWGSTADVVTITGDATATFTTAPTITVAQVIDTSLDKVWPDVANPRVLFCDFMSRTLETSSNATNTMNLSLNGDLVYAGMIQYSDTVREDDVINRIKFLANGSIVVSDGIWNLYKGAAEFEGDNPEPTGLLPGMASHDFDNKHNLLQAVETGGLSTWRAVIDQDAATATALLAMQQFYIRDLAAVTN